ncbi:hypothetical protein B0H14DRAFT_2337577 [Mycena olivaceomarginata]|nr:hypothetical protein B0H14DRAFT_2337577 [Mycena olivaceomarginata]
MDSSYRQATCSHQVCYEAVGAHHNQARGRVQQTLRKNCKAPQDWPGAITPLPIPPNGLWQLDVEDTIFQDVGLYNRDDISEPPLWLCNDKVKAGIKAVTDLVLGYLSIHSNLLELQHTIMCYITLRHHLTKD